MRKLLRYCAQNLYRLVIPILIFRSLAYTDQIQIGYKFFYINDIYTAKGFFYQSYVSISFL